MESVTPGAVSLEEKKLEKKEISVPLAFRGMDTEKLKASVTEQFEKIFHAETRERTLFQYLSFF